MSIERAAVTLLAALLTGLSVLVALRRPRGGNRLGRVMAPVPARAGSPQRRHGSSPWATPRTASLVAGGALVLLVPVPVGPVLAVLVAVLGPRVLAGLEPAGVRAERARLAADLPLLLDLLGACLAGGAALPEATRVVAAAVPGPAGQRLAEVGALLSVGAPPEQAWAALTGRARTGRTESVAHPDRDALDGSDPLAAAARALARATDGGAPVAAAVARLASEARAQARADAEQAARRVGVLVVAPLGLCFLPAFVLLGVVPVVVGLAGPLLDSF